MNVLHPFRRATQIFGLLITNLYVAVIYQQQIYTGMFKSVCLPFLYCHSCPTGAFACPLGVMQHYSAIHRFPFFLVGHLMIVGLLVGRMVCGWVCPVGLLQDVTYRIKTPKIAIPRFFSVIPYIMLIVLVVLLPYITTEHWFSKLCPVGTVVAGIPWVTWNPINPSTGAPTIDPGSVGILFAIKILILIGALWFIIVAKRPFCRYICPMGLCWSFFNKVSIMKMEVDEGCTKCDACRSKCPKGIKIYEDPNSKNCIRCLECTDCKHVKVVRSLPIKTRTAVNRPKVSQMDKVQV